MALMAGHITRRKDKRQTASVYVTEGQARNCISTGKEPSGEIKLELLADHVERLISGEWIY